MTVSLSKVEFGHRDRHAEREEDVKAQGSHLQAKEHPRPPEGKREQWARPHCAGDTNPPGHHSGDEGALDQAWAWLCMN